MKYPYIRAWHYLSGSFAYYIKDQVSMAIKDKAPANAIYKSGNGKWRTIDEVENQQAKEAVIAWVETHKDDKVIDDV